MDDFLTLSSVSAFSNGQNASPVSEISKFREANQTAQALGQPSFSDALADNGVKFVQSLTAAESASIAGMKGEMGVYEVASTVMEAEQRLRMVTAVRDRMVQAYLEISRMQI